MSATPVEIAWLESGKPVVASPDGGVEVSLSHDDRACLCVAGDGPQGCDLAPVTPRSREQWRALVGADGEPLLARLAETEPLDVAGTRVWAAAEALRKAAGSAGPLELGARTDGTVVFHGAGLAVLTFPVRLTRGPERIVAVVAGPASAAPAPEPDDLAERYGYDPDAHGLAITEDGPLEGLTVVSLRFPVTFRECANLGRSVYFSHVFVWMGMLREVACQPVYVQLAEQFATGRWGMVTNHGETRFLAEVGPHDVVEGRFFLGPYAGPHGSTQELHYEWRRVLPGGGREPVAWSRMAVTWVEILDHGIVEPRPFPDYYQAAMDRMTPPATPEVRAILDARTAVELDLGPELARVPAGPVNPALLRELVLETALEDANLVGNVYFANYYLWQGRVRDHYFRDLAPVLYRGTGEQGELRCLWSRVDHLREAMPFDRIAVRMSLDAVHERGVRLRFDYFRAGEDGSREKLAVGRHAAAWVAPVADGSWEQAPLPEAFRAPLLAAAS